MHLLLSLLFPWIAARFTPSPLFRALFKWVGEQALGVGEHSTVVGKPIAGLVEITQDCWQGQKIPVVSGQTKENMSYLIIAR